MRQAIPEYKDLDMGFVKLLVRLAKESTEYLIWADTWGCRDSYHATYHCGAAGHKRTAAEAAHSLRPCHKELYTAPDLALCVPFPHNAISDSEADVLEPHTRQFRAPSPRQPVAANHASCWDSDGEYDVETTAEQRPDGLRHRHNTAGMLQDEGEPQPTAGTVTTVSPQCKVCDAMGMLRCASPTDDSCCPTCSLFLPPPL
eukprot:EG_transcript_17975